jgi:hypothetical protein
MPDLIAPDSRASPEASSPVESTAAVTTRRPPQEAAGLRAPAIAFAVAVIAIAIGLRMMLRLPGVPYNVRELFLDHGDPVALTIFAVALIWVGGGSMLLAHGLARSRRPFIVLPIGAVAVAIISRTLLKYSVTYESLDDILGTSNLFQRVTNENIWGEVWRRAFLAANVPDLITFFERRVRYIALYSLLAVSLALVLVPIARASRCRAAMNWRQFCLLVASASAWLWLSQTVAFTWAATDNLTELIATNGLFDLRGGPFLYLTVLLIATNAALLIRAIESGVWWPHTIAFSIVAVPVGWLLLGAGLAQQIDKYGVVFSGTQFLLGPDRRHSLSEIVLFIRWALVQSAAVTVIVIGAWSAHRFAVWQGERAAPPEAK